MPTVSQEEFIKQVRTHERVNLIIHKEVGELESYIEKHPNALPDDATIAKMYARINPMLPPGTWAVRKPDGNQIMNRMSKLSTVRIKPRS